jgi:hypothetical protein
VVLVRITRGYRFGHALGVGGGWGGDLMCGGRVGGGWLGGGEGG